MIHIYVLIALSAIVFIFCSSHRNTSNQRLSVFLETSKILFGVVLVCSLVLTFMFVEKRDDLLKNIPFVSIDDSKYVTVDNSATMLLSETSGAQLHEDFILDDSLKIDELASWLDNRYSSVDLYVKSGSTILYSKSLGRVDRKAGTEILDTYNLWKSDGVLPKEKIRYKFLCFYMDV